MTLAVMTRASLSLTVRARHAGPMAVLTYMQITMGALLRVFGPITGLPTMLVLGLSAVSWSGAYVVFDLVYGPFLLGPSLDD